MIANKLLNKLIPYPPIFRIIFLNQQALLELIIQEIIFIPGQPSYFEIYIGCPGFCFYIKNKSHPSFKLSV